MFFFIVLFSLSPTWASTPVADHPAWTDEFSERAFEERVRRESFQPDEAGYGEISRREVMERARAALNFQFHYRRENSSSPTVKNSCAPQAGDYWLRPRRLDDRIEKTVKAVPYKWGGYFLDLESFAHRLRLGDLAGDICTCRSAEYDYCLVPEAAGLDCSGFVSYAWKIPYHVTSSLHEVSQKISWDELKSGDILNKSGTHVMLFDRYADPGKDRLHVIESSTNCDGVCESLFSARDLRQKGYVPLRYVKIRD